MTNVKFHGRLGKVFGKEWNLAVNSIGEAIHAINILKGRKLYPWLLDQDKKGIRYKIIINDKPFKTDLNLNDINNVFSTELVCKYEKLKKIDIVPVIEGAGDDILGIFTLVLGVVLIATGIFAPLSIGLKAAFIIGGVALLAGGIASLLMKPPEFEDFREIEKKGRTSYLFNGPQNTTNEGGPIPIGYGRLIVGSQVVASSYVISDISARTDIGDLDGTFTDIDALKGYPIREMIWGRNETILFSGPAYGELGYIDRGRSYQIFKIKTKADETKYKFSSIFSTEKYKRYVTDIREEISKPTAFSSSEMKMEVAGRSMSVDAQNYDNSVNAITLTSDNYVYVGGGPFLTRVAYNHDAKTKIPGGINTYKFPKYATVHSIITPNWKCTLDGSLSRNQGLIGDNPIYSLLTKTSTVVDNIIAFGFFLNFTDSADLSGVDYDGDAITSTKHCFMLTNTASYLHDGRLEKEAFFSSGAPNSYGVFSSVFLSNEYIMIGQRSLTGVAKLDILTDTGALYSGSLVTALPTFTNTTTGTAIGTIYSIFKIDDNTLLIGGNFEEVTGKDTNGTTDTVTRKGIIKLKQVATNDWRIDAKFDCSIWGGSDSTFNVKTIYSQADGKIMVGGDFNQVGQIGETASTDYNGIVRLNSDGSIDTDFDCKGGFLTKAKKPGVVYKILVASNNNNIYVCGDFWTYKGEKTKQSLVRLIGG